MEFVRVKGDTWCLLGALLVPVYRQNARECILLDSGWEWEREELREALERERLTPVAVIGSHAHEDHIGNHRWLKETYGTELWMPEGEALIASGEAARKGIYRHLPPDRVPEMAFETDRIIPPEDGEIEVEGVRFRIHYTPGHSPDHICIGTPDGICYVGDLVMSGDVCRKARLPFHANHRLARKSMESMLKVSDYSGYLIAHRSMEAELAPAIRENLDMLDQISEYILELTEQPVTWDGLMDQVLERNQLSRENKRKFALYEWAVMRFIEELERTGKLAVEETDGERRYRRI